MLLVAPAPAPAPESGGAEVVAWIALVISLCAAAWNVIEYLRTGPRVDVRLEPGVFDPSGSLWHSSHRVPESKVSSLRYQSRFSVEAAKVTVTNRGRTAVTIDQVVFDLEDLAGPRRRERLRKDPFRRRSPLRKLRRRRVTMNQGFEMLGYREMSTDDRVRLDAHDSVTFLFDASHMLTSTFSALGPPMRIRAQVRAHGARRPVRSPRRSSWVFKRGERPWLYEPEYFDLGRQLYRTIAWRVRSDHLVELISHDFCMKLAEVLEAGTIPDRDQIAAIAGDEADPETPEHKLRLAGVAFALEDEIAKPQGGLLDASGFDEWRGGRRPALPHDHAVEPNPWRTYCEGVLQEHPGELGSDPESQTGATA